MNISEVKDVFEVELDQICDVTGLVNTFLPYIKEDEQVRLEKVYDTIRETFITYPLTFDLSITFARFLESMEDLFQIVHDTDYENFEELADMFKALRKHEVILQNNNERFLLNFKEDFIKDGIIELIDEEHSLYAVHSLDNYFSRYYGGRNDGFYRKSKKEKIKHIQRLQKKSLRKIFKNQIFKKTMSENSKDFSIMTDIYHADKFLEMYSEVKSLVSNYF